MDKTLVSLLISFLVISFKKYFSLINLFEKTLIKYLLEDIIENKFKVSFSKILKPVYFLLLTVVEYDTLLISEIDTSSVFMSGNASIYLFYRFTYFNISI